MGIKEINKFLINNTTHGIRKKRLSCYRNKIIAIDVSIFLYRILYRNKDKHIEGFLNLISKLRKFNIKPIFVFDGKPPKEKKDVLRNRKKNFNKIKNRITDIQVKLDLLNNNIRKGEEGKEGKEEQNIINLSDSYDSTSSIDSLEGIDQMSKSDKKKMILELEKKKNKLDKKCVKIKGAHIDDLKEFFDLLDIMYVHTNNMEADKICADLVKKKYAYACISNDMDMLPFGCSRVLREFNFNNQYVDEYNLDKIEYSLGLNHNRFVDLCIMCGCDYNDKIIGLKPHALYKYLQHYRSLENVIENIENINEKEEKRVRLPRRFDYESARYIFTSDVDNNAYEICNKYESNCFELDSIEKCTNWRQRINKSKSDSSINYDTRFNFNRVNTSNKGKETELNSNLSNSTNSTSSNSSYSSYTSSRKSSSDDDWIIIESKKTNQNQFRNEVILPGKQPEPERRTSPTYRDIKSYLNNKCPDLKTSQIQSKLRWILPRSELFSIDR